MVSGVVLCGGSGRRFGGENKPLLKLAGRPMVEYVLQRLAPQVDEILISANRDPNLYATYGRRVVADRVPGQGPLGGIAAAAAECRGEMLFVCPGDAPCLPPDLVARLQARLQAQDGVVAEDERRRQPLFLLLRRGVALTIPAYLAAGGRSVQGWLSGLRLASCRVQDPCAFVNVNTPEDLAALEAAWPAPEREG